MSTYAERFRIIFDNLTDNGNYHRYHTSDMPSEVFVWAGINEVPGQGSARGVRTLGWLARNYGSANMPESVDNLCLYEQPGGEIRAYNSYGEAVATGDGTSIDFVRRGFNTIPLGSQALAVESGLVAIEQLLAAVVIEAKVA